MKKILISAAWAVVTLVALHGQTPPKSELKRAELRQPETPSNRELNTRAYTELLRIDVKKAKSQIMGQIMLLDAEQAAKFWPIYKSFETELTAIGDKILVLVRNYVANYEKMTNPVADDLAIRLLGIEQQRNELKKKYYLRMKEGLDAITAARFLQVENQLERLIDLQISAELPVIREQ